MAFYLSNWTSFAAYYTNTLVIDCFPYPFSVRTNLNTTTPMFCFNKNNACVTYQNMVVFLRFIYKIWFAQNNAIKAILALTIFLNWSNIELRFS